MFLTLALCESHNKSLDDLAHKTALTNFFRFPGAHMRGSLPPLLHRNGVDLFRLHAWSPPFWLPPLAWGRILFPQQQKQQQQQHACWHWHVWELQRKVQSNIYYGQFNEVMISSHSKQRLSCCNRDLHSLWVHHLVSSVVLSGTHHIVFLFFRLGARFK